MSSSLRRGSLAATAIAFSIASLAACGAGNNSQTLEIKPDNAATTVGDIKIQNAVVITQPIEEATGPAVISATLFNNGTTAQTLDSVTVDDSGSTAEISPAKGKGKLTIPAGGSVVLGGANNASAVLASSREAIQDGNAQKITFTFSSTGPVSLRAFVVPADNYFKGWGPSEVPTTAEATPTAAETPGESTSASPSDSASESASATATATESAAGN